VDTGRNIENIRTLIGLLDSLVGPIRGSEIIDYGAGTGLALEAAGELSLRLIGVEPSLIMGQRAAARGMKVWTPGDLARQPQDSLPSAIASYVLHLLPHTHGLRLLWSRLRPRSALVANFHKSEGIDQITDCLRGEHCKIVRLKSPDGSERHGPYIAYVKTD